MTLIEKRQKLAALVTDARAKLDAGDLEAYNKMDADIDKLEAEIKAEEKQQEREAALSAVPEAHAKPQPTDGGKPQKVTATAEYKSAFFHAVRGGKASLTGEERKILSDVMTTGAESGGMLVMPAELETSIRELIAKQVVMRRLATVITTTADRKITLASGYGAASWIDEGGDYAATDDTFENKTIGSHKLGRIIKVSEELLNDAEFDLQGHISLSFGRAFTEAEEPAYLSGATADAAKKPVGALTDAQIGVTTAASTAVTSDELLDLFFALKAAYRNASTFLMGIATEKALRKLKNATTGDYMWQPGLTAGQPNTLLGRPVEISDYMPDFTAGNKIIAFGDFKQYTIKDTVGMRMQVLDQPYADKGLVGFKGYERTDGKLIVPEAIQTMVLKAGA